MTAEQEQEETAAEPPLAAWSDAAVARWLRDHHFLTGSQYDAYCRRVAGETFPVIAATGPINPFTGRRYDPTTIEDWFRRVVAKIAEARTAAGTAAQWEGSVWGIWIAQSHVVRVAANRTPEMVGKNVDAVAPASHFPDAERMKARGKKPR